MGALLGVARQTVQGWFTNAEDSNSKSPPPDARVKLTTPAKEEIVRALIFKRCEDGSAKWAKRLAKIAEEGKRKKSEAAKGNANAAKDRKKTDAVHDDLRPSSSGKNVAREARAAEAKVSPATMARDSETPERLTRAADVLHC